MKTKTTFFSTHRNNSLEIQGGTKLILSTESSHLRDLAKMAVKMALEIDTEVMKLNIEPLPILELNLTGPGLFTDPSNFSQLCCFTKTYERPGQTVELVISDELQENGHISYSMDVGLDRMVRRETVTCRNGKVEVFGLLKGRVNLREHMLKQQGHVESKQCTALKGQLLKVVEGKEELKNALKESNRQKENLITENKKIQAKMEVLENHLKIFRQRPCCSSGWTYKCFHGNCACYKFFTDDKTWEEASQSCNKFVSELVSIHSKEENDFVGNLRPRGENWSWIGFENQNIVDSIQWSDGTPLDFVSWNSGNQGKTQNFRKYWCAYIGGVWSTYKWRDDDCSATRSYVCKQ